MRPAIKALPLARCLLFASAIGTGAACHLALPFASSSQTGADGQARDLSDLASPDSPRADNNKVDGPRPDAPRPDAPRSDAPRPDAPPPDAPPLDAPPKDLAPGEPSTPCSSVAGESFTYSPGPMALCKSSDTSTYNQCTAVALCNQSAGWYLCTASEFKARGGQTVAAPVAADAWIAGCTTRAGGLYGDVTDGACPCSAPSYIGSATAGWPCTGKPSGSNVSSMIKEVAVRAYSLCYRVGADTSTNEAYWYPTDPTGAYASAARCK